MGAKSKRRAQGIVDPVLLGRCLRSLRIRAGYATAEDFCEALRGIGVNVHPNTLYVWERGERLVPVDALFGILTICRPLGGIAFCREAFQRSTLEAIGVAPQRRPAGH